MFVYLNAYLFISQSVLKEVIIGRNYYAFLIHLRKYMMCSDYHWLSCLVQVCYVRRDSKGHAKIAGTFLQLATHRGSCSQFDLFFPSRDAF